MPAPRSLLPRLAALLLLAAAIVSPRAHAAPQAPEPPAATHHRFDVAGDHFQLDGKPFQVISGEMHYARIPRAYWLNRIRMARAMGLNTIATYVFWNVHEPRPNEFDFSGNNDLVAFIRLVQQEGMYVLLRAGPYDCAEWDFGGFPAWLLKDPKMSTALRTRDPAFMVPATRFIRRLAQEVGPLQIDNGGPILATQVENEYGNFSNDHAYMQQWRDIFLAAGFNRSMLYTVDPSKALSNGEIPGVYSGVNFGTGRAAPALAALANIRPGQPLFATEYWPGWFDLWGHPHETRPVAPQLADLDYILGHGASVNIYMVHGGTSFGMMAGASKSTGQYRGNVTSYDYDAPIDEAGHPTPKFYAYRDVILKYTHAAPLPVPATPPVIAVPAFALTTRSTLFASLPTPLQSPTPLTMEQVDQSFGYILYRTHLPSSTSAQPLKLNGLKDFALVYLDGKRIGTLDRHYLQDSLALPAHTAAAQLDILVENTGRLNSTKLMRQEHKGITAATLAGTPLTGWQIYRFPLSTDPAHTRGTATHAPTGQKNRRASTANTALTTNTASTALTANTAQFRTPGSADAPILATGTFNLTAVGDTYLDTGALGKGLLWINGHCLGRFWNIGPQRTLYLPGAWLHPGNNQVTVLDLLPQSPSPELSGLTHPILDAPGYATDPEHNKPLPADTEFGPNLNTKP